MPEDVTVSFTTRLHRMVTAAGKQRTELAEVDHPVFGKEGSKIFVEKKMIHEGFLANRLMELHDAVEIALSHLDGVICTGDQLADDERRAACASHAREVLRRVV